MSGQDKPKRGNYGWVASLGLGFCKDCGVVVVQTEAHDRFHAILDDHARAIAVLVNAHIGPRPHDRWNVRERIGKTSGGWSAEAFTEVVAGLEDDRG